MTEDAAVAVPEKQEPGIFAVLRGALFVAKKDLRVEWRSKEILLTTGYFGLFVVLVFSFSFVAGAEKESVVPGILWVAIAFSGALGLGRVFEREREGDCIRALLLSPIARTSIYLGKVLGVLVFMVGVQAVVLPAVWFFFNLRLSMTNVAYLLGIVTLGTLGYAIVGTLLASMLIRARSKDVLLAIVLYPLILPMLIIGVQATGLLFAPELNLTELKVYLRVLGLYDAVFLVANLWIFEPLLMD
ncbi:MAG: heme exporter protein CcmB [Deltaproteobacteria bacterium]